MDIGFRGFLITVDELISVGSADGDISSQEQVRVERMHGCNDTVHVGWIDKIFYNKEGEVIQADHLSEEKIGPCDGTCFGKKTVGKFLARVV